MNEPLESAGTRSPSPSPEDLLADLLARRERGEAADLEEYCRAHPESARELVRAHGEIFGLLEDLDRLGSQWTEQRGDAPSEGAAVAIGPSEGAAVAIGPVSALSERVLERLTGRVRDARRYRVEGEVARGGMGSILLAWDEELRRQLAMKVMLESAPRDRRTRDRRLARFLEEAQITGQLDHPGVVPIHELGVDEHGRVFFTMKLVRGRTLEEVFRERQRDPATWTRTRLIEILLRICEAMAYAHAKGVVHRDLKPANVMVGRFGEVYVMDWGLARVLGVEDAKDVRIREDGDPPSEIVHTAREDARGSDPSSPLYTVDGDVVGTPAYMAPEQARGRTSEVGTRSDVYSVGAILYEMLAGSMPYAPPGTVASHRTILRRVREGPPQPVHELAAEVPAELVAIQEKAMARDAEERYASMQELAADLRAFVEGRVVRAYRTGALVELEKWVRRNRALAAALLAALVTLVGGLGGVGYVQAKEGRIALDEATKAEAVSEFLAGMLRAANPYRAGPDVRVMDVLDAAEEELAGYDGPDAVRATLLDAIGVSYQGLGELDRAREHVLAALEIRRRTFPAGHRDVLRSLNNAGVLLRERGELEAADALLREAVAGHAALDGPEAVNTLVARHNLVTALYQRDAFAEAEELGRSTLAAQRRVLGDDDEDTIKSQNTLGMVCAAAGELGEAEALFREAAEHGERALGPDSPVTHTARANLAYVLRDVGRLAEAREESERCVRELTRLLGDDHPSVLLARSNLALILREEGNAAAAEPILRDVHRRQLAVIGPEHRHTLESKSNLALVLAELTRHDEAEALLWECLEEADRALGPEHDATLTVRHNLGLVLSRAGRHEEAAGILEEVLAARRSAVDAPAQNGLVTANVLAAVYVDMQRWEPAEALLRDTVERQTELLGPAHPQTITSMLNLGWALRGSGRRTEAEELWARTLELAREHLGAEHSLTATVERRLGELRAQR